MPKSSSKGPDYIKRPPNCFVLYRADKQKQLIAEDEAKEVKRSNGEYSVIIGDMWKDEAPEVKEKYRRQAKGVKDKHYKMYPNYKFQARLGIKNKNKENMKDVNEKAETVSGQQTVADNSGMDGLASIDPSIFSNDVTPSIQIKNAEPGPSNARERYPTRGVEAQTGMEAPRYIYNGTARGQHVPPLNRSRSEYFENRQRGDYYERSICIRRTSIITFVEDITMTQRMPANGQRNV